MTIEQLMIAPPRVVPSRELACEAYLAGIADSIGVPAETLASIAAAGQHVPAARLTRQHVLVTARALARLPRAGVIALASGAL